MEEAPTKTCPFCERSIDINLIEDHILCHQIENGEEFNNHSIENPYGNVNENHNSNYNNISNNNNNQSKNKLSEINNTLNGVKAIIEINNPENNGKIDFKKVFDILGGKYNNNNDFISTTKDAIKTLYQGFSLAVGESIDLYKQYNELFGKIKNENNVNNVNPSNQIPISVSTDKQISNEINDNSNVYNKGNNNNLSEDEVNSIMECLPKKTLKKKKGGVKNKCLICDDLLDFGQSVVTLPCSHTFHFICIKLRIKNNNTCPNCKFEISLDNIHK